MRTINYRLLLTALYHLLSWVLLFSLAALVRRPDNPHPLSVPQAFISFIPYIVLFYVNAFFLVPGYFDHNKRSRYILIAVVSMVLAALLSGLLFHYISPFPAQRSRLTAYRVVPGFFCLAASLGFGAVRESMRREGLRKEKENENLRTELSFLRSQVNPHFMLNVINSIVAAARVNPAKVEPALIELAALMSYMLYNNAEEKVTLDDEIEYLETYIKLQMLRFGDDVQLDFSVDKKGNNPCIEPMMLIPLVENAFKHGLGLVEQPVIQVRIRLSATNEFDMQVKNKYNDQALASEDKYSGIGLTNLRKRLQLIYPGHFTLTTLKTGQWFISSLNLRLA